MNVCSAFIRPNFHAWSFCLLQVPRPWTLPDGEEEDQMFVTGVGAADEGQASATGSGRQPGLELLELRQALPLGIVQLLVLQRGGLPHQPRAAP